jgi:two-component system, sensor histidine kinase and response regulator
MSTNNLESATPDPQALPVDMVRMLDLAGGEKDLLHDLVELYLVQTGRQLTQIAAAIQANQPEIVRREAHSSGGASATLGVTRLSQLLRELESQGKTGTLTTADALCADAQTELLRVRSFLAIQLH